MTRPLAIDLYSDVVCPWCWVGKRRLERVLREHPDVQAEIRWRPFRLRPDMPPEGEDWREIIETKFGGAERAAMMFSRVAEAGRTEGIDFAFDRIARSPNTMDAHRLLLWAGTAAWPLAEALHTAYFVDGRDIGNRDVLVAIVVECGLDDVAARAMLESAVHVDEVVASQRDAARLGVTGVPFTVLDARLGVSGAQPPEVFREAIRQALESE
jgi:predicted DsbA family dithiol-disulfide isomerase